MGRARSAVFTLGVVVATWLAPQGVHAADPRDAVADAFITAADQLNQFDLEGALVTLDNAIASASASGLDGDPSLAKLHAMRAGISYSVSQDRGQALESCMEAVKIDHNVKLPIELASEELTAICNEARAAIPRPTEAVVHTPPPGTPNADIEFVALANQVLPMGSTVVMYWRSAGSDAEFEGREMANDGDGNWGVTTITVAEHNGKDIEYFFYAFDPSQNTLVNRGDKKNPLLLEMDDDAAVVAATGENNGEKTSDDDDDEKPKRKRANSKSSLARVFINLGVGTGLGIARGTAEQTYEQYTPGIAGAVYGVREQACAFGRWYAGAESLAPDQLTFQQNLAMAEASAPASVPYAAGDEQARAEFAAAYDPSYCGRHHPVSTGLALAPFHVVPEIGVRVARSLVVSVYARLQVVTGSQVYTDNVELAPNTSITSEVRSTTPQGLRRRPPFTWAVGAKLKYFLGKDDRKFRLFAGGFFGYGQARLRVPMNFSNDRNGNSVPDLGEIALSGPLDANGNIAPETCTAVWPYHAGCDAEGSQAGDADRQLALGLRGATALGDERIDTVVIGPVMFGALFGFNYQIHKNFALFAEINAGAWLPSTSSALFDLNVGPAITF